MGRIWCLLKDFRAKEYPDNVQMICMFFGKIGFGELNFRKLVTKEFEFFGILNSRFW